MDTPEKRARFKAGAVWVNRHSKIRATILCENGAGRLVLELADKQRITRRPDELVTAWVLEPKS